MAVIDAFRKPEVHEILRRLQYGPKTTAELNDSIITTADLDISTATLYRRLKELLMANVLEKVDGKYQLTSFGGQLYQEFLKTSEEENFVPPKEQLILNSLSGSVKSKTEILSDLKGSNTELIQKIDSLKNKGYIKQIHSKRKKRRRGRPASNYTITAKGEATIADIQDLKKLARHNIVRETARNNSGEKNKTPAKTDKEKKNHDN